MAPNDPASKLSGAGDMFLYVKGAKHGVISGEAQDDKHKNEIEVLAWSWGMQQNVSVASGLASGKATVRHLTIKKHVDKGSTALMSALRTNEGIKEALLTIRKWGKNPLEYLTIKIEDGRVASVDVETDASSPPALVERVSFSFTKIKIEYTPQGPDGQAQGSTSFEDTWTATV